MERCSFEICNLPVHAEHLCSGHYQQYRRGKKLKPLRLRNVGNTCSNENCLEQAKTRGMCKLHYEQARKSGMYSDLQCAFADCYKPAGKTSGYCRSHQHQLWQGKTLSSLLQYCECCNIEFSAKRTNYNQRFCSDVCANKHLSRHCAWCGKSIDVYDGKRIRSYTNYCSRKCASLQRQRDLQESIVGSTFGQRYVLRFAGTRVAPSGSNRNIWRVVCLSCGRTNLADRGSIKKSETCFKCGIGRMAKTNLAKRSNEEIAKVTIVGCIKQGRKRKNKIIPITLADDEIFALSQLNCHYCGCPPENTAKLGKSRGVAKYNGLDRIDSNGIYEKTNVVACCGTCNVMKMDNILDQFLAKCKLISARS